MNFHNTTQVYARPVAKLPFRNHFRPADYARQLGKAAILFKQSGKVVLFVLAAAAVLNCGVMYTIGHMESSISNLENSRHALIDKNIEFRARKAYLNNPLNFSKLAQDKLSLDIAGREQVMVFDSRKGVFRQGQFDRDTKTFVHL
jgi:hypothetical protein